MTTSYDEAVAGWAASLRAGRAETWSAWQARRDGAHGAPTRAGGGQLELARRIVAVGADLPDLTGLVDLVLTTPAVGRGPVEVPLPWPDHRPATEPERLTPHELLRVATGVLVRLLPTDAPDAGRVAAPRRSLRDFFGRRRAVVLALPLEVAFQQLWTRRVLAGHTIGWPRLWRAAAARDRVPLGADPVAIADRIRATGVPPARIQVVVATEGEVADPAYVELRRRVNAVPGVRDAGPLADWTPVRPAGPLAVPGAQRSWAAATGQRLAERLADSRGAAAGYPVHGDPALLAAPSPDGTRRRVDLAVTLDLAVSAIREGWTRRGGAGQPRDNG